MTEAVQNTEATTETTEAPKPEANPNNYEQIRDSSPLLRDETRQKWQYSDRLKLRLSQEYDRLLSNEELVDEAKRERAAAARERSSEKIVNAAREAKESLLRDASILERRALPWPSKQPKDISNSPELLGLAFAESDRLSRMIEKRSKIKAGGDERLNPFFDPTDFLVGKLSEALSIGGLQGSALAHGVRRACEEVGIDENDVFDRLRTDEQKELFDNARRLAHYSRLVDDSIPQIPRGLGGERRRGLHHGLTASADGPRSTKRKARWK